MASTIQERWNGWPSEVTAPVEAVLGEIYDADISDVPEAEASSYALDDAIATRIIFDKLYKGIESRNLQNLLKIDMGIVPFINRCHRVGMLVDIPHFKWFSGYLQEKLDVLQTGINKLACEEINPDSPDQVAALLFDKLEVQKGSGVRLKRTPVTGRYKADDDAMKALKGRHPIIPMFIEYRELSKLKGSFSDKLPKMVDRNNRIHTKIKLTRTATARLASENPNLQQIPTRTELSKNIRKGFIAGERKVILSFDFSSIEPRISAHVSRDEFLINVFHKGLDPYTSFASNVFGVPYEQVNRETQRKPCKSAELMVFYGGTPAGLADQLMVMGLPEWTEDRCEELIKQFFKIHSGVAEWVKEQHSHARLYGWVDDMFGRRLWTPFCWSTVPKIREEGLRMVQNFPIQAAASSILKLATAKVWEVIKEMWKDGIDIEPLMSVHDELLLEIDEVFVDYAIELIKPCFEKCIELLVPVKCGASHAINWGLLDK